MGSIHQNGDRLREPQVGDTRRPAAGPESRRWVDRLCWQHERQILVLSTRSFLQSKSVPVVPRYGTKCALSSGGRRGLKNSQKPLRVIFLQSLACRDRSQIIDSILGPGIVPVHALWTPKNFFVVVVVVVSAVLHFSSFRFSFFFLLIVALHKHWITLNHLTVSSACFGDAPSAARFRSRRSCTCWLWTFSQWTSVWV